MSASGSDPKVVRKAGEGFDRPNAQAELPIDINYQKLSEWLVSAAACQIPSQYSTHTLTWCMLPQVQRQKLPADWHKRLQAIQSKITEAVKELPAGLLAGLLGSTEAVVDYFAAVKVRDRLAETGERTLFGGLTGQAGVWDKIVRAYENGGEHLLASTTAALFRHLNRLKLMPDTLSRLLPTAAQRVAPVCWSKHSA